MRHIRYLKVDATPVWQDSEKVGYGLPDAFDIGENWISEGTVGIAHGPVLLMIENARTGLIWKLFVCNEHIRAGIQRAGFLYNLDPKVN